jgi:hypothetical protein
VDFEIEIPTGDPLRDALKFTLQERDLNRVGKLSPEQKARIENEDRKRRRNAVQTIVLYTLFFGGIEVVSYVTQGASRDRTTLPGMLGVFVLVFSLLLVFCLPSFIWFGRDVRREMISVIEGAADPQIGFTLSPGRRIPYYKLAIHAAQLQRRLFRFTTPRPVKAFQKGERYRVYYIKYYPLDIVLSAEKLADLSV